jgi:hypothetical protein
VEHYGNNHPLITQLRSDIALRTTIYQYRNLVLIPSLPSFPFSQVSFISFLCFFEISSYHLQTKHGIPFQTTVVRTRPLPPVSHAGRGLQSRFKKLYRQVWNPRQRRHGRGRSRTCLRRATFTRTSTVQARWNFAAGPS